MSCNDWKEVKLGEVCEIKYGKDHKKLKSGCIPVYGSGGIMRYVDKEIHNKTSVLIPRKGTLSNLFFVKPPFWTVDTLFWTDIFTQIIFPKFLYYQLCTLDLSSHNVGTAVPSLTTAVLNELPLSLPPLPEQKAIADTLSCLDDKIELNNKINKNLEAQAQAIFKSWFVDFEPFQDGEFVDSELGRIPKGWKVGTLGEVAEFQNGYAFKSKDLLKATTANCYDVFKMGHIKKGGGFYTDGTKSWILKERCKALNKYVLKKGDLLMCMTDMKGNVALLGHTALMNTDNKYIFNQRVGLLRPNGQHNIGFPYLYLLTNNSEFIENLRNRANSGVQVNLSSNEIKISKLFIPPNDLNTKFNEISMLLFETIFEKENEIKNLTALRDTLLPKLMSGEIRVPVEVE